MPTTILGVNHQFLYPESIENQNVHTKTLKELSKSTLVDALDCWIWRGAASREERKILLDSGKIINYNIGDRFGENPSLPASPRKADRTRAYDTIMREVEYGLSLNTKKIVFAGGPDYPEQRDAAKERLFELVLRIISQIPNDVVLALEPTDRDIDKKFLFGPMDETSDFVNRIKAEGFSNMGLMIDMCHVPIMHETLESALQRGKENLVHVHLGNCMIKDKSSVYYGDKHIPFDYPDGEYSSSDCIRFIKMLKETEYLKRHGATVSFEMRPIPNLSAEESLDRWVKLWKSAI